MRIAAPLLVVALVTDNGIDGVLDFQLMEV